MMRAAAELHYCKRLRNDCAEAAEDEREPHERRDTDPAEHDAGDRESLAGLPPARGVDLIPRGVAEHEGEDRAEPPQPHDAEHERSNGIPVGHGRLAESPVLPVV